MSHTPGPWKAEGGVVIDRHRNVVAVRKSMERLNDNDEIGQAYRNKAPAISPVEADANCKLLATAPDLLQKLKEQTNWFIAIHLPHLTEGEQKIWWREIGNQSQAAIAKAEGVKNQEGPAN